MTAWFDSNVWRRQATEEAAPQAAAAAAWVLMRCWYQRPRMGVTNLKRRQFKRLKIDPMTVTAFKQHEQLPALPEGL
jgi:hypothetical protein